MKKAVFKTLSQLNKILLPSLIYADLTRLSKIQKAMVAWRYWVTINAVGGK